MSARGAPVALIQTPLWGFVPPLSLAQLTGELRSKGVEVSPIDLNSELFHRRGEGYRHTWSWEQNTVWLDEKLIGGFMGPFDDYVASRCAGPLPADRPSLAGFSVNECSIVSSLHVARLLKRARPLAFVAFGGQAFAQAERIERCLKSGAVDAVVMGDGESVLLELTDLVARGGDPASCPGLRLWRGGRVVDTGPREPVDLDKIAFCDFASLGPANYEVPENLYSRSLMIMASRGCVRRCMFCGSRRPWEGYRYMSGRRVYDEIKHQLALHPGLTELKFYDIATNGDVRRLRELCGLIAADPAVRLSWEECNCIVRPEMDHELLSRMRDAGCHRITYGIESGSDRVLRLMRKGQTAALAEKVLLDTHRAGLVATANFMFGFPGETEEDFEETLEFVRRVHSFVDLFYPSRTMTTMEPLSDMAASREELGLDDGNDVFWASKDGTNTYPVRLERYERFSRLLKELGARESPGVNSSLELHRWYSLGEYHEYKEAWAEAAECHRNYLRLDPGSAVVQSRLALCERRLAARA